MSDRSAPPPAPDPAPDPAPVPFVLATRRARLTWLAAGLLGLESAGLLGGAVFMIAETVRATPESLGGAIALAVVLAALGAGLAVCVAGVLGHRGWVRGPVVTWQLVQAGVSMRLTVLVSWWLGLPLLAIAVIIGLVIAGPWVLDPREPATG